jgi:hypothetical protein
MIGKQPAACRARRVRRFDRAAARLGAILAALFLGCIGAAGPPLLVSDYSNRPDGLVTNEYAYRHPTASDAHVDATWELTSGSLFVKDHRGYSGIPDHVRPNADSSSGTNSAVFRARTNEADFGDVTVSFNLQVHKLYDDTGAPPSAYDGVHVWLRYQSEYSLYAVTVSRRDGIVVIKKKSPGGPSNGGTYFDLASHAYAVPFDEVQHVEASAHDNADGSVAISLAIDGHPLLSAVDTGAVGGPALVKPGRVGIRGDNCEFYFAAFRVDSD